MTRSFRDRRFCILAAFYCLTAFSITGCGNSSTPDADVAPRHTVSGKVTLDGQPAERVVVNFAPREGTPGMGGYAIADASGNFSVVDINGKQGLQEGSYNVTFSKRTMLDGSPIPPDVRDSSLTTEALPQSLTTVHPTQHRYIVELKGNTEDLVYDLKSKK